VRPGERPGQDQSHIRLRRIGLTTLRVVGVVVAVVAVVIGATMLVLRTRWGGERLRRQLVTRVNHQIQGELGIGRLSFGGNRVVVWDVTLNDADGKQVAQVARAEVDFRIMRLLHEEMRLSAVVVESPRLLAESDADGLNLSRALAPRQKVAPKSPPKPKPHSADEGWVLRLDRFDLRDGAVLVTSTDGTKRKQTVHLEALQSFLSVRYATGNGATDLVFRLDGRSVLAPVGPLAIKAEARVRGTQTHFTIDGQLLGGDVRSRGDIDSQHPAAADALVAIAIPRTQLGGYGWGPLRVDGQARPGTIPTLDLSLAIPGIEVTAKGGAHGNDVFKLDGRVAVDDLARTGKAAQVLTTAEVPPMAGHGDLRLTLEGPPAGALASWNVGWTGLFNHLRIGETTITDLSIEGHAAELAKTPGDAALTVTVASASAGSTRLGKLALDVKARQQMISLSGSLASPDPISLALTGRLDDDRQGLTLSKLSLSYPQAEWVSDGTAHLRSDEQKASLSGLRIHSRDQQLAVDATKDAERVDAHVALTNLRLDLLPALVAPRELNLAGVVDLDVKATGEVTDPKVVGRMTLENGRFRTFSKLGAAIDATLADQQVDGTLSFRAPFTEMRGEFHLPAEPLQGGAINLRLAVEKLDLAEALQASQMKPSVGGRVTARLRVTGTARDPRVVLTVDGRDLNVKRPASATEGPGSIDMGHASIRLKYEDREAHTDIDFASAQGGALRVDAAARINLAYPAVTREIDPKRIPVHGKVVAKDFDVAWLARFNEKVESLGGKVTADAKVAGTVGDPQFIGDVRWKNGKVISIDPRKAPRR
jgi:autotransporter translocation and assembly factor TamB